MEIAKLTEEEVAKLKEDNENIEYEMFGDFVLKAEGKGYINCMLQRTGDSDHLLLHKYEEDKEYKDYYNSLRVNLATGESQTVPLHQRDQS